MWGVGNVSYGLTMRHLGMSLGMGVAIGVTLVVGTLEPPIMHGQFTALFSTRGGLWSMAGIVVALIGIAIVSYAGHQKEAQMGAEVKEFNVMLGLALAVLCGIFSAGFSFGLDAATPIWNAAKDLGVNPLFARIPSYVLIMGGGAIVNLCYCFIRLAFKKELSLRADLAQPSGVIARNSALAASGGVMWYPAVLLLLLGRSQYSAEPGVRELDAAYEHVCTLRRASWALRWASGRAWKGDRFGCCGPGFW